MEGYLIVVTAVIVLGAAQYAAVRLFPLKKCPRCGGTGWLEGPGGYRPCGRCHRTGEVRRWGAGSEE